MLHSLLRFFRGFGRVFSPMLIALPMLGLGANPAFAQYAGYWHTSGNQILDSSNPAKSVRISGVNWYGFETTDGVVHGLASQDYKSILATVKGLGYNTVRLPYANQIVETPIIPSTISYSGPAGPINSDLKGLNSLQIMDKIISEAGALGLKVILDNHRSESGNSAEANGLWYTSTYPESSWIADWKTLVARYSGYTDASGNPTVIGVDLRNEPHNATSGGSCWTGDSSVGGCPASDTLHNWPAAAGRGAAAVLAVNSKLLIFVEGVDCYNGDCDFWGGNLEGAKNYPVPMPIAQRLVGSAHDYGPKEYQQVWFNSNTTPQSLEAVWTKYWAYLSIDGYAPVWVGEFGTTNDPASAESTVAGSEGQWFSSLVTFLGNQPNINWTYWALNGEDNYGLLDSTYDATPPSSLKQQLLSSIQAKVEVKTPVCEALASVPAGLAAKASSSSAIGLTWNSVASPANCSVSYSVFRGTTSGFAISSTTQIASGLGAASYADSGLAPSTTYYYAVAALDGDGRSAASAKASATTAKMPVCAAAAAAPGGLNAKASSSSAIGLSWNPVAAPTNCSVSYSVFRGATSSFAITPSTRIASGLSAPGYADSGLTQATAYYYAVEAVDGDGSSAASAVASATTPKAVGCAVGYTIVSDWGTGFQAALTLENTGSADLNTWILKFNFPGNQQVTSIWNATYSQSGAGVAVANESYNGTIAPGQSYTAAGFTGSYSGADAKPAAFSINGVACGTL
jgi:endoglucanase